MPFDLCIPNLEFLALADYRETAAKFQKEWHIKEPHRHFEFAPHVKSHALVSVINRGLIYHSLERQYAQKQVRFMIHACIYPNLHRQHSDNPTLDTDLRVPHPKLPHRAHLFLFLHPSPLVTSSLELTGGIRRLSVE